MPIKNSETRVIKRSQINLNPINPKRHQDEQIKLQKKNLQKVGYLGGIVWNETTGNLIDGHRRVMAMDLYYHYDGTNDYDIKVEVCQLDDKTEKEQVTYMALANTKADIDLVAEYIGEIDTTDLGLSDVELEEIMSLKNFDAEVPSIDLFIKEDEEEEDIEDIDEPSDHEPLPNDIPDEQIPAEEAKIQHMKDVKAQVKAKAVEDELNESAYITLSFSSYDSKADFCQLLGISDTEKFAKGEDVLELIS